MPKCFLNFAKVANFRKIWSPRILVGVINGTKPFKLASNFDIKLNHSFPGDDDQARLEVRLHLRPKLLQEVQERQRPTPYNPSPYPPFRRW